MNKIMALIRPQKQVSKGVFKNNYPEKFLKTLSKKPATQSFTNNKLIEVPWPL